MGLAAGSINDDETAHAGYNSHGGIGGAGKLYLAARDAYSVLDGAYAALLDDDGLDGDVTLALEAAFDEAVEDAYGAATALGVTAVLDDDDGIVAAYEALLNDSMTVEEQFETVVAKIEQVSGALATFAALKGHDAIGDGQIAQLSYSLDALTLYASAEQVANGADYPNAGDTTFGIGAKYSMDMGGATMTAGLGYQTTADVADTTAIGLSVAMENGLSAGVSYTVADVEGADENGSHLGLGVGYTMNALSLGLNYGVYEYDGIEKDGFGLAMTYDLGGGLAAHAGFGSSNYDSDLENFAGMSDNDTYSLGLSMSF
jgi:outer membrane protein OmpU